MLNAPKEASGRMHASCLAYTDAMKEAGVLRGGYYLIEAPDLDAALSWAARCPGAAHGSIEVRPVWAM